MKVRYIAHKISGDVEVNTEKVKQIIAKIHRKEPDIILFAPYLIDLMVLDDNIPEQRAKGMANNQHFFKLGFIDELAIYSEVTTGIKQGIEWASKAKCLIVFK
jgi:hypothetical protein